MSSSIGNILFSPEVRTTQTQLGSTALIQSLENRGHWRNTLSQEQIEFLKQRDSFYLGTASCEGRPYIQHRGGQTGFIHIENESTFWFPDFNGNRHYISIGHLSTNAQAFAFFMDYPRQRRLKIWGSASVHPRDELINKFDITAQMPAFERAIKFEIEAVDENCRQYISPRFSEHDYQQMLRTARLEILELKQTIKTLEAKVS